MKENEFHKKRIAFMIINDEVKYLIDSVMSHEEWFNSLNFNKEDFNTIIRGYYKDNKLIFYKGNFIVDDDVVRIAKEKKDEIIKELDLKDVTVYCGVKKGVIGEEWPPILKI